METPPSFKLTSDNKILNPKQLNQVRHYMAEHNPEHKDAIMKIHEFLRTIGPEMRHVIIFALAKDRKAAECCIQSENLHDCLDFLEEALSRTIEAAIVDDKDPASINDLKKSLSSAIAHQANVECHIRAIESKLKKLTKGDEDNG